MNNRLAPLEAPRRLTTGGIAATFFDLKQTMRLALERSASAIAIAHNHPSGNLNPSKDDFNITERTKRACEFLEIKLIDHIIVGQGNYYSFFDNDKL